MNQGILVISYMITVAIYLGDVNMSRAECVHESLSSTEKDNFMLFLQSN